MTDGIAAWQNMIDATPCGPFVEDVSKAVSNSGDTDAGKRWLLTLAVDALRSNNRPHGVIAAYDFSVDDFQAIDRVWPVMRKMATTISAPNDTLPTLARFVAERLPAIWSRPPWIRHASLTRILVIADRAHDLVGLFANGIKPNGSKDPFALRRAANHWLMQVVSPHTIGATA